MVSQNLHLAQDAGDDVLLIAGRRMTNWFHGHATVSGIAPGDWLDWRQTPAGLPLPSTKARIQDFLAVTGDMGAYVAAAIQWPALCVLNSDGVREVTGICPEWTSLSRL